MRDHRCIRGLCGIQITCSPILPFSTYSFKRDDRFQSLNTRLWCLQSGLFSNVISSELSRRWSGWGRDINEPFQQLVECDLDIFHCRTLFFRERNSCQHALEIFPGLQELPFGRTFRQVEVAASTGHAMWALLKEAVGTVAVPQVEVLPGSPGRGLATLNGLTVDEHLDRSHVP